MTEIAEWYNSLSPLLRIPTIIITAIAGHFIIRGFSLINEWIFVPRKVVGPSHRDLFVTRHPKAATISSLVVSALTFTLWFVAFGLILAVFNVSLTAYLATASIVGLAVAFGSQSLVQDMVVGLTLVFTDALDIGDMVEVSGQIGRVEMIGLRFTKLTNILGQSIFIPNRNIIVVGRYRRDCVRAYFDVQIPDTESPEAFEARIMKIAFDFTKQFDAIIMEEPRSFGIKSAGEGWRYLRIRFRIWPGQQAFVETAFKQRVLTEIKASFEQYQDWMVSVVYKVT